VPRGPLGNLGVVYAPPSPAQPPAELRQVHSEISARVVLSCKHLRAASKWLESRDPSKAFSLVKKKQYL